MEIDLNNVVSNNVEVETADDKICDEDDSFDEEKVVGFKVRSV